MRVRIVVLLLLHWPGLAASAQPPIPFEEDGKWGVLDAQKRILIPAQFEQVGWPGADFSVINGVTGYRRGELWGIVAIGGKRVTEALYPSLAPGEGAFLIAHKVAPSRVRPLAGVVTTQGVEVVPFLYDVLRFSGLRIIAAQLQAGQFRSGLLDVEGKVVIPLQYESIRPLGSLRFAAEKPDGSIELFADDGRKLTLSRIDSLSSFQSDRAVYYQNLRQGLIDREGNFVTQAAYASIRIQGTEARGYRSPTWRVLTSANLTLDTLEGEDLELTGDHAVLQYSGSRILHDRQRNIVGVPFEEVHPFAEGAAVVRHLGRFGVIRDDGNWLLPPQFDQLFRHGSFYRTMEYRHGKKLWRLWGSLGLQLSVSSYDNMLPPQRGHYPVTKNGYWGLLDEYGRESAYCVFDSLFNFSDDLIAVGFRGKYGLIDYTGNWKLPPQHLPPVPLDATHFLETSGQTKFIRRLDGYLVYFTQNSIAVHPDHFVEMLTNGTSRQLTFEGVAIPPPLAPPGTQEIYELQEGLRGIKKDGRYGFVDSRGRLRIANRYEAVRSFDGGLAPVMIRGRWGFIDKSDRIAIQPMFDEVSGFSPLAIVRRNGKYGLLDRSGALPLEPVYDSLYYDEGYFVIRKAGKLGLSTLEGRITLEPKYDYLHPAGGGFIIVGQNDRHGLVTREGLSVIPMIYEELLYQPATDLYYGKVAGYWEPIH